MQTLPPLLMNKEAKDLWGCPYALKLIPFLMSVVCINWKQLNLTSKE